MQGLEEAARVWTSKLFRSAPEEKKVFEAVDFLKGQQRLAAKLGPPRIRAQGGTLGTAGKLLLVIVVLELLRITVGGSLVRSVVSRSAAPGDDAAARASQIWARAVLAPLPGEEQQQGKQRPDYFPRPKRREERSGMGERLFGSLLGTAKRRVLRSHGSGRRGLGFP